MRRAARNAGVKNPWLEHVWLAHGLGLGFFDGPSVGSDLGEAYEETVVFEPGVIVVCEPCVWEDGHGGYRSEDVYVVTEEGPKRLSNFTFYPFED